MRRLVILAFVVSFLWACAKAPGEIPVETVSLNQTMAEMMIGETFQLKATVLPEDATDKSVKWESSNQSVATVSNTGLVTAVEEGTSTITAFSGNKRAPCIVTVGKKVIAVESVELNMSSLTLVEGEAEMLTAIVKPENATDRTITWSTSDSSIATIDDGMVTAMSVGEVTVTAMAGNKKSECIVTVKMVAPEAVDLGLSVKWALFNLGAKKAEDYGDFFAWGEVKPKDDYSWSTYKFGTSDTGPFTKYNTDSSYGTVDNKTVLDPEDDAAYIVLGEGWRMPTGAEMSELRSQCTWVWLSENGVSGYQMTGPNGNSIFLPAAGYVGNAVHYDAGSFGLYWSSSNYQDNSPAKASILACDSSDIGWSGFDRYWGLSVRPVIDDPDFCSGIKLNKALMQLHLGETGTLVVTVYPNDSPDVVVSWVSSDESIATVANGVVTAIGVGETSIIATVGDYKAECKVIVSPIAVPEAIDLGLSVKWASFNVGAKKPEEYGDYYAWGEVMPKKDYSWMTYKFGTSNSGPFTKYNTDSSYGTVDNKTVLDPEDDAAHIVFGEGWRMPTDAELNELRIQCAWKWTTENGVDGYIVTAANGNSIFLPATGERSNTSLTGAGSYAGYWSSSLTSNASMFANILRFYSYIVGWDEHAIRYVGLTIRPVTE